MIRAIVRRSAAEIGALLLFAAGVPAEAATFRLTSTNIDIAQPSPLFTSSMIGGTFTLADAVLPGQNFAPSDVRDFRLNFAGITGTFADIQADIAPDPVQIFGTRSTDGNSFSVFDFRFGFPTSTRGCSFVCAGQIIINSPLGPNDPSDFIALDDVDGNSLSVINNFTPRFDLVEAVPEPASWAMMILGMGIVGIRLRRRPKVTLSASKHTTGTTF